MTIPSSNSQSCLGALYRHQSARKCSSQLHIYNCKFGGKKLANLQCSQNQNPPNAFIQYKPVYIYNIIQLIQTGLANNKFAKPFSCQYWITVNLPKFSPTEVTCYMMLHTYMHIHASHNYVFIVLHICIHIYYVCMHSGGFRGCLGGWSTPPPIPLLEILGNTKNLKLCYKNASILSLSVISKLTM